MESLVGGCQCGAVRYEVADAFRYAANCHCSRCRAATGTAFKAFAGIERKKLAITSGLDKLLIVGEEAANDTRCGVCGSLLFSVVCDGAFVHVAMGSLVDVPSIRPTEHIFVVDGAIVVREPNGERTLECGDLVCFPPALPERTRS